jgi:integrase
MRLFKPTYSKPLPEGAKIVIRKKDKQEIRIAQFMVRTPDGKSRQQEARPTKKGDGILVETTHWHIAFADNLGIHRTIRGFTDRQATQRLADRIQDLLNYKASNAPLTSELQKFIEQLPGAIRNELVGFGLLDLQTTTAGKPLMELAGEFEQFLTAKERSPQYVTQTTRDIRRVFAECAFVFWSDINANKLSTYLKNLRDSGLSYRRSNAYLKAMQMFCKWMVDSNYVSQSLLQHLKALDGKLDQRHVRRVLELDELLRLLETTAEGPERFGLGGYERSLLYRFATETGLRANEIRTLTVGSFNFDRLIVKVEAGYSKHRREDTLSLRLDTAAELKQYFANKLPTAKVFSGGYTQLTDRTAEMIRADLQDAGIAYKDESGQIFDFHSLRHQTGSLLAASGVHPKVAQTLMRHSDINLTMSLYSHTFRGQESEAVKSLPNLRLPSSKKQKAVKTGTDERDVAGEILSKSCFSGGLSRTIVDGGGQKNADYAQKTALRPQNEGAEHTHNPLVVGSNPTGPSAC